ncbi:hydroxymethylglutaryl-CoA lyase [Pseudalkalibacillus hwajinpoensis]|uniref:Hydroxymethylglutaryl-CoA lyase n=1 Tax=Guptibacillus hwajinpoensis TaxID=208199 RepID=A0A4U1MHH5_9BACL|nr:hydroxymethylglutaryl-CoA lyase [Pseudalkalibacillus hwajinpoensis]TKD69935.1 hydroxymethylglutaryl-CoA lyase [Pseudalkalibacillus hwajinpoensis]
MIVLLPEHVTIIEVGPRDGLQNEANLIPTEAKINFIQLLKSAGFNEMELTSFVSPKWVPQMKDASEITDSCLDETRNFVLAPNRKGIERVRSTDVSAIAVFAGVSNSFNQKNSNKKTDELLNELLPLVKELKSEGYFIRACISTAFYCPYEGKMDLEDTILVCKKFVEAGVDELSVADTIGMATPEEASALFSRLTKEFKSTLLTAHFHDTRGMALANIYACLQAGISRFDTSAGGLGGCPFAKGATGNVATESVVYMLDRMGISTGINLDEVMKAVDLIEPYLSRGITTPFRSLYLKEKEVPSN